MNTIIIILMILGALAVIRVLIGFLVLAGIAWLVWEQWDQLHQWGQQVQQWGQQVQQGWHDGVSISIPWKSISITVGIVVGIVALLVSVHMLRTDRSSNLRRIARWAAEAHDTPTLAELAGPNEADLAEPTR